MKRFWMVAVIVAAATAAGAQGLLDNALDATGSAGAGARSLASGYLSTSALASHEQVAPGQQFEVAVEIKIEPGWAYYSPNPGGSGDFSPLPAGMKVLAEGFKVVQVLWPADRPHEYLIGKDKYVNNAYDGAIVVYVSLIAPADMKDGRYPIIVSPTGQICGHDTCVQVEKVAASVHVSVGVEPVANPAWSKSLADGLLSARPASAFAPAVATSASSLAAASRPAVMAETQYDTITGLGLALLAGLILNIMPCVLPVIPLKVLGIVQQAKESRRRFVTLGLSFAGGVVLFFVGVAIFNAVLKLAMATTFQWGEHFQSTPFRIAMAMLMVALAANLFGAFTVLAPRGAGRWEAAEHREGHLSALAMGVVTGVLSTPCSFAILTAALVWAQSQPLWLGSAAIVTIGVGMALPYALLTAFPGLLSHLPEPGRWMELFKQLMGFVLLLVAVWLLSTASGDVESFWRIGFAVVLAMGLWIWGSWVTWEDSALRKTVVRLGAVALVTAAGVWMLTPARPAAVQFEPFNLTQIEQARKQNRVVVIDFTASWCLTCKAVEARVYDDPAVAAALRKANVLAVRGDVTTRDLPANELKEKLGEAIPVTVVYGPGAKEPIRLRGIFSPQQLLDAVAAAGRPAKR